MPNDGQVDTAPSHSSPGAARNPEQTTQGVVVRNTFYLTLGQIAGMPLSIASSAILARYLGAAAIGYMYLASTFNSVGNLAVDWGQSGALPQLVAQDRSRAGVLLGSSLVWRLGSSLIVLVLLLLSARLLGHSVDFLPVLALMALCYFFSTISSACQQTIIGFERTDVSAYRQIIEQFAGLVIILPIVLLGGGLHATMAGSAASVFLGMLYAWRSLRSVGVTRLTFESKVLRRLLAQSTPFAFTSVVSVLQPYIDALYLARMSTPDVVGWHAAARKLLGVLVFPASAVIGALYPTLCRLYASNRVEFVTAANGALRGTSLLALPAALGCFLYPDIGIAVYSNASFGPAQDNLRILSVFLFLAYFTMPLGIAILAANRQRAWAVVQAVCVFVSLVADPFLIPWTQGRAGNGGLGVAAAAVFSEIIVLVCAIWLAPNGIFDKRFWRSALSAFLGGAAMTGVALALRQLNSFLAAPVAVTAYGATVWVTGGVDPSFVAAVRQSLGSKLGRLRRIAG